MSLVDLIIPSWDNQPYLQGCLQSVLNNTPTEGIYHVYVVNNGHPKSCDWISHPHVTVLQAGKNLGWEGGLKLGLEHSKAPFVMFLNDDAMVPPASRLWITQLLQHFRNDQVAAVGPSSNVVMGHQNIFSTIKFHRIDTKFLIGFCMVVRRSALDEVGGVDDSLPGGDDLDLSIRLRDAGYKLIADREVFVYHHGFKSGERKHGTSDQPGGWNSYEFKEKTDLALIGKHGFKKWWETMRGAWELPTEDITDVWADSEGGLIAERVAGEKILELGCGGQKTVPQAVGVDMVPANDVITALAGQPKSVADVTADVSQPLPFEPDSQDTIIARHVLEHLPDPISALRQWAQTLKPGGKLIVAVPDNSKILSIPMNYEHCHGWDMPAMKTLFEVCGLKVTEQLDSNNGVSFITVGEKSVLEEPLKLKKGAS